MALTDIIKPSPLSALAAPFHALGRFLILLAESSSTMREIEKLNAMSDAELAERGTTREAAVRRLFAGRYYI